MKELVVDYTKALFKIIIQKKYSHISAKVHSPIHNQLFLFAT